jgi:hypothetical protein
LASVEVDLEQFDEDFPDMLLFTLERERGEIVAVDGQEQQESYEHLKRGRCMTCGNKMKSSAQMLIVDEGIAGIWCRGECLGDIVNVTFLERVADMVVEGIDERKEEGEDEGV